MSEHGSRGKHGGKRGNDNGGTTWDQWRAAGLPTGGTPIFRSIIGGGGGPLGRIQDAGYVVPRIQRHLDLHAEHHDQGGDVFRKEDDANETPHDAAEAKADARDEAGTEGADDEAEGKSVDRKKISRVVKVHRAEATPAPAANPDEAKTPIETPGSMDGEGHTLTADPISGEVSIASVKMNARAKVQQGLTKLEAGDQSPDAVKNAKAALNDINARIDKLEKKIGNGKHPTKTELMDLSREVMDAVTEFGSRFKVKDLHDPLSGFPGPIAKGYPIATGGPRPDGTTPEAHHVPNNELFQGLVREMEETGKEIKRKGDDKPKLYRDIGKEMLDKVDNLKSTVGEGGRGLAAILTHRITHQNIEQQQGTAVHSAKMADVIMAMLVKEEEKSGIELEKVMDDCCVGICVKPQAPQWDAFLERIKAEAESGVTSRDVRKKEALMARVAAAEEEEKKISKRDKEAIVAAANQKIVPVIKDAHEAGMQQGMTAVTGALGLSLVDGTEAEKNTAITTLRGLAVSTWACITDVSFGG